MSDEKRFEGWEEVDCNDCSHYWDSTCDGATKGSRIGCNSYLATRKVVLPERLNHLEKPVLWLKISVLCVSLAVLLHLLSHITGAM